MAKAKEASTVWTAQGILERLQTLGLEYYKKIIMKHGALEPVWGVKIEEMKKIQKDVKMDYQVALDLFDSGVYDAMYLAGLIADDKKMTKKDLQNWAKNARSFPIAEFTVAWVAAGSDHGWDVALSWIDSKTPLIATAGWSTLSGIVAIKEDSQLDQKALEQLMERVGKTIHQQPDRVRYTMNGFLISLGTYVTPLTPLVRKTAKAIGKVTVDMGDTSCKVPDVGDYLDKVEARGALGKKKKTVKC